MAHDAFDALLSGMDPAMVVLTTSDGTERSGCLVGFQCQSSIEPPRYVIWVSRANHTFGVALRSEHFAVHALDQRDVAVAALFGGETGDEVDKFSEVAWEPGPDGVPLLVACPNRVVLHRLSVIDDGGDHVGFVTEPVDASTVEGFVPLRLSSVRDLDPGHPAD